jgi:hypothetical protein
MADAGPVPVYMPPGAVIPPEPAGREYVAVSGQPSRLAPVPGDAGTSTEWDASTLEGAITWLETHSTYLGETLVSGMDTDIRAWLAGPADGSGTSPFGTYPTAVQMAGRQLGHYTAADQSIRAIARDLWQAAQTLRVVLEQYETAERANELSASSFDRIFTEQGATSADRYSAGPGTLPTPGAPVVTTPVASTVYSTPYGG